MVLWFIYNVQNENNQQYLGLSWTSAEEMPPLSSWCWRGRFLLQDWNSPHIPLPEAFSLAQIFPRHHVPDFKSKYDADLWRQIIGLRRKFPQRWKVDMLRRADLSSLQNSLSHTYWKWVEKKKNKSKAVISKHKFKGEISWQHCKLHFLAPRSPFDHQLASSRLKIQKYKNTNQKNSTSIPNWSLVGKQPTENTKVQKYKKALHKQKK